MRVLQRDSKPAWLASFLLATLLASPFAFAQTPAGRLPAPQVNTGIIQLDVPVNVFASLHPIPVGKPAPDFQVKAADGKIIQLSQFKNKKNVVIVFYQGHFCPICGKQLANLQTHYADFQKQEAEIIAVSADALSQAQMTLGEKGLSYLVVPDPQKTIIRKFGIANVGRQDIAWPSAFIIDKKGIVRFCYADERGHRLHSNELLSQLSKITGKPAPKLSYDE